MRFSGPGHSITCHFHLTRVLSSNLQTFTLKYVSKTYYKIKFDIRVSILCLYVVTCASKGVCTFSISIISLLYNPSESILHICILNYMMYGYISASLLWYLLPPLPFSSCCPCTYCFKFVDNGYNLKF